MAITKRLSSISHWSFRFLVWSQLAACGIRARTPQSVGPKERRSEWIDCNAGKVFGLPRLERTVTTLLTWLLALWKAINRKSSLACHSSSFCQQNYNLFGLSWKLQNKKFAVVYSEIHGFKINGKYEQFADVNCFTLRCFMHCDDSLKLLKLYKRCYSSLLRLT